MTNSLRLQTTDIYPPKSNFLLIDNFDSFTYNIQDYFAQLGFPCIVIRNDEKTVNEIADLKPEALILSPGPETPSKAGSMMQLIKRFHSQIPILGVCLGHQGIGQFFGCNLVQSQSPMHGKTSEIFHYHHSLFEKIPSPFNAMRYHSLLLENIPTQDLEVIAQTSEKEVMVIVSKLFPICGIQFHPESILTEHGLQLLRNWLQWSKLAAQ